MAYVTSPQQQYQLVTWADSAEGTGNETIDIKITLWGEDCYETTSSPFDNGCTSNSGIKHGNLTASSKQVYLKVEPKNQGSTGNYKIKLYTAETYGEYQNKGICDN